MGKDTKTSPPADWNRARTASDHEQVGGDCLLASCST